MNDQTAPPYVEIKTLFERREDFTVNTEKLRRPEFGQVCQWLVTEKIDGTNIRVSLENIGGVHQRAGLEVRPAGHLHHRQLPGA